MLIRRAPVNDIIDRFFEDTTRDLHATSENRIQAISLDVTEQEDAYVVTADLPGVNPDDIDIRLHEGVLTISAETRHEHSEEKDNGRVLLRERRYGKFSRSLRFPNEVNSDGVEASYEGGVLTLTIPKAEEAKPRVIRVNQGRN